MEGSTAEPPADFAIIARPNCSLSPAARRTFLYFLATVVFGIAIVFAWFGAWLLLPFAGAEVGLLVWAFRHCDEHAGDYEKISISGDRLLVECKDAAALTCHEFSRHWAQVTVNQSQGACQVTLGSHGRAVEVGRYMSGEARRALAKELRMQLGNQWFNHQRGQQ